MRTHLAWLSLVIIAMMITQLPQVYGQDATDFTCDAAGLEALITRTAQAADDESDVSLAAAYQIGAAYQAFALACGYQPTLDEVTAQIDQTLSLAPLQFIIAQSSIGTDVEAALAELEETSGDSFNGQLLYNGLEVGLDGAELGCAGCHNGEAAPITEGTYTRIEEQRLMLPELSDYMVTEYLVESILHPTGYIVPEYAAVQMPANYGGRLDAQMLADLVAYLESQDQLLDDVEAALPQAPDDCIADDTSGCGAIIAELIGDAVRGEQLYTGAEVSSSEMALGCAGCHTGGVLGPTTMGTWSRVIDERLMLPQFEGYTAEQYLIEAIYYPSVHIVDGYADNIMPANYAEQMSDQDLADLIAYLRETG